MTGSCKDERKWSPLRSENIFKRPDHGPKSQQANKPGLHAGGRAKSTCPMTIKNANQIYQSSIRSSSRQPNISKKNCTFDLNDNSRTMQAPATDHPFQLDLAAEPRIAISNTQMSENEMSK